MLAATALQLLALGVFWGNRLLGHELAVLTLPAVALLYIGGAGEDRAGWRRDIVALAWTAASICMLAVGAVAGREIGQAHRPELLLAGGTAGTLLLASAGTLGAGPRVSRAGRTLVLGFALAAALALAVHYRMAYDVGRVRLARGAADYVRSFGVLAATLGLACAGLSGLLLAARADEVGCRAWMARVGASRVARFVRSPWLAPTAAGLAALATLAGLTLKYPPFRDSSYPYPSRPLFAWYPLLPLIVLGLPRVRSRWGRWTASAVAAAGAAGTLSVDLGLGSTIFFATVVLGGYHAARACGRARLAWLAGLAPGAAILLLPTLSSVVATWAAAPPAEGAEGAWARVLERIFAMLYPGWGDQGFAEHLAAGRALVQGAVEHGGLVGDGFWNNRFYVPMGNTDLAPAVLFHYYGVFGYGALGLLGVLIGVPARAALGKAFHGDRIEAEALGVVALACMLTLALPLLWTLAALAGVLPWTGVPAPFLSRGVYYQGAVTLLVGWFVLAERRAHDAARPQSGATPLHPPPARIALLSSSVMVAGLGAYATGAFFHNLHRPVLRGPADRPAYILVPENAGEAARIDLRQPVTAAPAEFRVGNTVLRRAVHMRQDRGLDDFVFISEYRFSRDEFSRGITIGREGLVSPVLRLPFLPPYVRERNDVVLFWESMDGRLRLEPGRGGARIAALPPGTPVHAIAADGRARRLIVGETVVPGTVLRIGRTLLAVEKGGDAGTAVRIALEPSTPERAYVLHARQGAAFRLRRGRPNVIGGLRLAGREVRPGHAGAGWAAHDAQYRRGVLRDRQGEPLAWLDEDGIAEYADPALFLLVGTHHGVLGRRFGLDGILDPVLSGSMRRGTVMDATRRSLARTPLEGRDAWLTVDLQIQHALSRVVARFGASMPAASLSALILDRENQVLAVGEFERDTGRVLPFEPVARGALFRLDGTLAARLARRDLKRYDSEQGRNPLLRRPLVEAFATDLAGSAAKGVIYSEAVADHYAGPWRLFSASERFDDSYVLAFPGDDVNTSVVRGVRVLTAADALRPFPGHGFPPIHNYGRAVVPADLRHALARSGNAPPAYLALLLQLAGRLPFAFTRFGLEQDLLVDPAVLDTFGAELRQDPYLAAEPVRFAADFDWGNDSDVARLGIGDKVYLSLLHLALVYSTILANDGEFIYPTVIRQIGDTPIGAPRFAVFEEASRAPVVATLQGMFRLPIGPDGTGAAFAAGLPAEIRAVGGKTGTASTGSWPHQVFVAVVQARGETYTIAVRVNASRSDRNQALALASEIAREIMP